MPWRLYSNQVVRLGTRSQDAHKTTPTPCDNLLPAMQQHADRIVALGLPSTAYFLELDPIRTEGEPMSSVAMKKSTRTVSRYARFLFQIRESWCCSIPATPISVNRSLSEQPRGGCSQIKCACTWARHRCWQEGSYIEQTLHKHGPVKHPAMNSCVTRTAWIRSVFARFDSTHDLRV